MFHGGSRIPNRLGAEEGVMSSAAWPTILLQTAEYLQYSSFVHWIQISGLLQVVMPRITGRCRQALEILRKPRQSACRAGATTACTKTFISWFLATLPDLSLKLSDQVSDSLPDIDQVWATSLWKQLPAHYSQRRYPGCPTTPALFNLQNIKFCCVAELICSKVLCGLHAVQQLILIRGFPSNAYGDSPPR